MKVAIYTRVSTQGQDTDRQESELKEMVKSNNWELVKIYTDVMSGLKDDSQRLGLHQLIEDAKQHLFDTILFSEFSRLSRKVLDLHQYIEQFRQLNITLYFQKQNIWVKPIGDISTDILLHTLSIMSKYEIDLMKERMLSGKINQFIKGNNASSSTTYGYTTVGKQLVINEEEANVVRKIFDMFVNKTPINQIIKYLTVNNIPTPSQRIRRESNERRLKKGKPTLNESISSWGNVTILYILKNETYIGKAKFTLKKENKVLEYCDERLRIISDKQFMMAQNQINYNKQFKSYPKKRKSLLKNKIKCGLCNSNGHIVYVKRQPYYTCYGHYNHKCSTTIRYKCTMLDGLIVYNILPILLHEDYRYKNKMNINLIKSKIETKNELINSIEISLNQIENKWIKYFNKAIEFDLNSKQIEDYKLNIDKEKLKLNKDLNQLKKEIIQLEKELKSIENENDINIDFNQILQPENHFQIKQLIENNIKEIRIIQISKSLGHIIIMMNDNTIYSILLHSGQLKTCYRLDNNLNRLFKDKEEIKQIKSDNNWNDDNVVARKIITNYYDILQPLPENINELIVFKPFDYQEFV